MNARELAKFDRQLDELDHLLAGLGEQHRKDVAALRPVVHHPGWTSVAEVELVSGIMESMIAQAKTLGAMKESLVKGANAVAVKQATPG